jgi:PAAR motif
MPPQSRLAMDFAVAPSCPITGPGAPTVLVCGCPASCLGDAVAGAIPAGAFAGVVTVGSPKVMIQGRPATRATSSVMGVLTPPPPAPPVPGTTLAIMPGPPPCTVMIP